MVLVHHVSFCRNKDMDDHARRPFRAIWAGCKVLHRCSEVVSYNMCSPGSGFCPCQFGVSYQLSRPCLIDPRSPTCKLFRTSAPRERRRSANGKAPSQPRQERRPVAGRQEERPARWVIEVWLACASCAECAGGCLSVRMICAFRGRFRNV